MDHKRLWAWLVGITLLLGAGLGFYQWEGQILTDHQYSGLIQDVTYALAQGRLGLKHRERIEPLN